MDQIESTKTQFTPENPFRQNFNELTPPGSDLRRPEPTPTKEKDQKDSSTPAIPDTSKAPRPGGVPSLKLSEGTDVFLPDMNWDILDKGTIPGADGKPAVKSPDKAATVPGDSQKPPTLVKPNGELPKPAVPASPGDAPKPSVPANPGDAPKPAVPTRPDAVKPEAPKPAVPVKPEDPKPAVTPRDGGPVRPPSPGDGPGGAARRQEITSDKHGNVATVKLPDGSSRTYKFDESGKELLQITDRIKSPSGERVEEWTRQADPTTGKFGDKFSRTQPAGSNEVRDKIKQLPDGSYEYSDAKGERKTSQVSMQGDAKADTPWKADIKRDEKGRFSSIENERFKREYQYFEGTTKIKSYHVVDKQSGQSATWSRSAPESANWAAQTGDGRTATLQGEFAVTDDGVHVIQRLSCSWGEGQENYAFLGNGTKVGIKATEGNGLTAAEGGTSRYVKRADGSTVSYTSSDNKQISVYDASTRSRTNWTQGADGMWKSDSPYEPEARKDLKFNDKGELSYTDKDGSTRTRTLTGEEIVGKKDGSKLVYDKQGKLSKVMYGDVTRSFQKDEKGAIKSVQETNAKGESKTIFPPALKQGEKFDDAKLSEEGDLTYVVKGTDGNTIKKVNERSNGMKLEHDKDNALLKASKPNGVSRSFEYAGDGDKKQLISVTDSRVTKDGEKSTVWARQAQPGGGFSEDFHSKDDKGKDKPTRKIGNVLPDGNYEYTTKDSKVGDKPKIQTLGGGDGGFSGSVEESRQNLLESMEKNLDEPRLKRMEELMKSYEQRMTDRAVARKLAGVTAPDAIDDDVSKTVSRTYDNISQMVNNDDPNTFFNKQQRAFLAENFMFHAQDPTTMDQGAASNNDWEGHGTCWIQAAHIWGMTQRTDHMADLLKQVSLTGKYTTKNSGAAGDQPKTVSFSKDYLKFPDGMQETNWSISKATDTWDKQPGYMRQCDGDRSPVGKIFDFTLPVIGNRSPEARAMDGGTHKSFTTTGGRWYVGNAEIMQMVTGDKPCDVKMGDHGEGTLINGDFRKTLLEKGTVLNYSPGHMKSIALKNIEGKWCVVQDNQHGENDDKIIARITDIQAWARGDRNAEQQVNEAVNQRKFKVESDSTIRGIVKPTSDDGPNNNQRYNSASNGSYYPGQNYNTQPGYVQPGYVQPGQRPGFRGYRSAAPENVVTLNSDGSYSQVYGPATSDSDIPPPTPGDGGDYAPGGGDCGPGGGDCGPGDGDGGSGCGGRRPFGRGFRGLGLIGRIRGRFR